MYVDSTNFFLKLLDHVHSVFGLEWLPNNLKKKIKHGVSSVYHISLVFKMDLDRKLNVFQLLISLENPHPFLFNQLENLHMKFSNEKGRKCQVRERESLPQKMEKIIY